MKKIVYNIIMLFLPVFFCLLMQSCKTGNSFTREPFSDYRTDAFFFRAVGQDKDIDMQRAKSKAIHEAKIEIARNAHSVCQQVVVNFFNQTQNNNDINLKEQFISISMESVSESLVHVIVDDVLFKKNKDNSYTCIAMVKVQKNNVFSTLEYSLQEKKHIDSELFKQVVDKVVNQINTK